MRPMEKNDQLRPGNYKKIELYLIDICRQMIRLHSICCW